MLYLQKEQKEIHTGVLSDISLLNVDSLIGVNRKNTIRRLNMEEKNFENKFKNLLQKQINIDTKTDLKNKDKDENLTIINILAKKLLLNINKINLIIVYLVSVSSINIIHLVLVILFILNVVSSIITSKINERKKQRNQAIIEETKIQYYVTKITLIVLQLCFLFEFFADLYKWFIVYSKSEEEKKRVTSIMKFILNYKEDINDNSCETLLFIIA